MANFPFKSALVTGASSGIGLAFAEQLAAENVRTIVVARRADRLEELAKRFDTVEAAPGDLNDPADLERVAAQIGDENIDLVINNAGFGSSGQFAKLDRERIGREVNLNVAVLTQLSHAALASMIPRRRGWLINVSSVASFQATPNLAVYAATKAYVTSLTEAIHEEAKAAGVKVTALCPGLTRTEFMSVSSSNNSAGFDSYPQFITSTPDDVARTALADVIANRALSIPGLANKALVAGVDITPRAVTRRLASLASRFTD